MTNKLRWDRPRGLTPEPNLNTQPYTKWARKADRKWIKKQKKKAAKIAALKNGELPKRKGRGRMSKEERSARREARREKYARHLEHQLDKQLSRHLQD